MNLSVDTVDNATKVFRIVLKINTIDIDDQQFACFVAVYPGLVTFVKLFQVVDTD